MDETKHKFLSASEAWVCDGYSLDIRYVARPTVDGLTLISAAIALNPLEAPKNLSFSIATENILVGQIQSYPVKKSELLEILAASTRGEIKLADNTLRIRGDEPLSYYSEMAHRDRWYCELHLQISGRPAGALSPEILSAIDNELRTSVPPFDGLSDVGTWLGLDLEAIQGSRSPAIAIRVGPPVDLIFERCGLRDNCLTLVLHAHPSYDTAQVGLAIRGVPSDRALGGRQQVAGCVDWGPPINNRREGVARLEMQDCDSVLAMLISGTSTVRRQWILDPDKAQNHRYLAVHHFDRDLRKIRTALFEATDPSKFEQGVAALLFLRGYSPVQQLETDSPDLIVSTPHGQLLLMECTLKVSDFAAKLGKLVDRRGALSKALADAAHQTEILAVLICRLPRDQIAAHDAELRSHKVLLVSHEELLSGFQQVRNPSNPDEVLRKVRASLQSADIDGAMIGGYNGVGSRASLM